jgi:DNA-binding NarL/FixJ family response regulator
VIRVLIADDNAIVRSGVAALLRSRAASVHVVGEAADGREAVRVAGELRPEVVLLDIRMPIMDGVAAARALAPAHKVLMLTYSDEEEWVTGAIRAGARGYLVHGRFEPDELVRAIEDVARGATVLSPAIAPVVFAALRRGPERLERDAGRFALTAREREAMNLVAEGLSNRAIAQRLVVTEKTVKNHLHAIYVKLGVTRRAEAIALWLGTAPRDRGPGPRTSGPAEDGSRDSRIGLPAGGP